MEPVLRVLMAGPGVTLQDGGRHGYLRFGVTPAGPMDPLAFATVHHALGNAPGSTAIEVGLGGLEVTVEGAPICIALAGGDFAITLDGRPVPPAVRLRLDVGARVKITAGPAGAWCYLAVAGQMQVAPMLGSTATHTRSGFGGWEGRPLAGGDGLGVAEPRLAEPGVLEAPWLKRPGAVIRVILGPQDDYFAPDQIAAFLVGPWALSTKGDRMAYFLEGPRLQHEQGYNIVSDGIAMGAVQVPGEGQPIILMADRQPTGGYPKIATVIGADLGRLAQLRAGSRFRFAAVTVEEAVAARQAEYHHLAAEMAVSPLLRREFSPAFLLGLNLTDGVLGTTALPVTSDDRHAAGKLTAEERLQVLFDGGRFEHLPGRSPSALITAKGPVEGRLVYAAARDPAVRAGGLTAAEMRLLASLLDRASAEQAPVVLIFDGLAAVEDEGTLEAMLALHASFHPTSSPRIAVVLGSCLGADALWAGLADFVIVAADQGFVASGGPAMVQALTNEILTGAEIGGAEIHAAAGGLVDGLPHDVAALLHTRRLLDFMPDHGATAGADETDREAPSLDRLVPHDRRAVYDVRDIVAAIADGAEFLEIAPESAANLVTGFLRLGGQPVAVLANQPCVLGGVLDAAALAKAARFVSRCVALSIPLLSVVDCPGLLPGLVQERAGLMLHAADLSRALAQFAMPCVTLVTRNAIGPAALLMGLGHGVSYRWPSARMALSGHAAASEAIGDVILPRQTRRWIVAGLSSQNAK